MKGFETSECMSIMESLYNIRHVSLLHYSAPDRLQDLLFFSSMHNAREIKSDPFTASKSDSFIKDRPSFTPYFFATTEGKRYLLNIGWIKSSTTPGVSPVVRFTDGALVVVNLLGYDEIPHIEAGLHAVLKEKQCIVLMIDGLGKALNELNISPETIYQACFKIIEQINCIISVYQTVNVATDIKVDAERGTVIFADMNEGWAFTLDNFAKIYAAKFETKREVLLKKFWGENYYNPGKKLWNNSSNNTIGIPLDRGFVAFILKPIKKLAKAITENNKEAYMKMCSTIGITLPASTKLTGEKLHKHIMTKWLSFPETVLKVLVNHLPSPIKAQKYRTKHLYTGSQTDICAKAMLECNPAGPLLAQVIGILTTKNRKIMLARIFAGTAIKGQVVRIMGLKYEAYSKKDLYVDTLKKLLLLWEDGVDEVDKIPAGNICGIEGIDKYVNYTGTITDCETAMPIRPVIAKITPVLKVVVDVKNPSELPKLFNGLQELRKVDPCVETPETEAGFTLAGLNEIHLESCIESLATKYAKTELIHSLPIAIYRETVTAPSYKVCVAKSPNKHNHIYANAKPLSTALSNMIEDLVITRTTSYELTPTQLHKYGIDSAEPFKLWAFGPKTDSCNILVDQTQNVNKLSNFKDGIVAAFKWASEEGVLAQESLNNVQYNLVNAVLYQGPVWRGGGSSGQIIPTSRRAFYSAQLTAQPRLQEPVFLVDIACPYAALNEVQELLGQKNIAECKKQEYCDLVIIKGYLPVPDSKNFTKLLVHKTAGTATVNYTFSHWKTIEDDPFEPFTKAAMLVSEIRRTKGLNPTVPPLSRFCDN